MIIHSFFKHLKLSSIEQHLCLIWSLGLLLDEFVKLCYRVAQTHVIFCVTYRC